MRVPVLSQFDDYYRVSNKDDRGDWQGTVSYGDCLLSLRLTPRKDDCR